MQEFYCKILRKCEIFVKKQQGEAMGMIPKSLIFQVIRR